jgi:hypothetical protein
MNYGQPIFDLTTHYQIQIRGRVDAEWLQRFDISAEIIADGIMQMEDITVLDMHTDQSGIVGLVRKLHGLGMTILQLQIVLDGANDTESSKK